MVVSGKYLLKERVPGAPTARQKESVFGGSTAEKIE